MLAVQRARAEAEAESVARIRLAGARGNLKADVFFLERSYPERWGRKRLEITGDKGTPLLSLRPADLHNLDPDNVADRYRQLIEQTGES